MNFTVTVGPAFDGVFVGCDLVVDGSAPLGCEDLAPDVADTVSIPVEYGVPFSVEASIEMEGGAFPGEPAGASLEYGFTSAGLEEVPTPEPSSALLLLPGLAAVLFAARRARGRLARA
jgi:hypothetical protein